MVERFDTLVIGGGMSGLPMALRSARHGTTAFVERELLGGTCMNRGCIPTKTMIASAQRSHDVRRAADLGVHTGEPTVDLPAVVDQVDHLTSRSILDLRQLPEHLIVVGGGFIGCEFAQMFARFGAHVTIVQRAGRLLPREDPDISAVVDEAFSDEGIDVPTGTACVAVAQDGDTIRVACEGTETGEVTGSHLLIATGRIPNTDWLGLEHLDLDPDERGYVPVDDRLHTHVEDVWALGDLRGSDMFTHTARDDADVAYRTVSRTRTAPSPTAWSRTRCSSTPRSPRSD